MAGPTGLAPAFSAVTGQYLDYFDLGPMKDSTSPAGRSSPAPGTPVGFSGTRLRPLYTGPSTSRRVFTSTSVVRARPRHQPPVAERHGTSWGGCPLPSGAIGPGPCLVPGTCNPAQGALHTLRNSSNGARWGNRTRQPPASQTGALSVELPEQDGGPAGTRTLNRRFKRPMLYYLSYESMKKWWAARELNPALSD